jgi:hypothetical protein
MWGTHRPPLSEKMSQQGPNHPSRNKKCPDGNANLSGKKTRKPGNANSGRHKKPPIPGTKKRLYQAKKRPGRVHIHPSRQIRNAYTRQKTPKQGLTLAGSPIHHWDAQAGVHITQAGTKKRLGRNYKPTRQEKIA